MSLNPHTLKSILRLAWNILAMIGAITPNILFAVAARPFPVPRSLVGKISGVYAYKTPYIILLVILYPQFHPSKALEVRAVVEQKRKTPVRTVAIDMAPLRPIRGSSTAQAAINAPGIPNLRGAHERRTH